MRKLTKAVAVLAPAMALGLALAPHGVSAQEPVSAAEAGAREIHVTILGMSCPFCAYGAEQKLKRLDGVEELGVALETGLATLTMAERAEQAWFRLTTSGRSGLLRSHRPRGPGLKSFE